MFQLLFYILVFFSGLCVGSFLNVVIHRGPLIWKLIDRDGTDKTLSLASPRSHCPRCRTQIKNIHLIPLLSFTLLRARCATCEQPISARYPMVELLGGLAALTTVLLNLPSLTGAALFVFFCFVIPLAVIDLETTFLPDALTLPFVILGLIANVQGLFSPLLDALIGAVTGFVVFWLIGEIYYRLRGFDGLGQGDAKLLAGIGAWLGWMVLPFVVLIAAVSGLLALFFMQRSGKKLTSEKAIPFGPFLAAAASIAMLGQVSGLAPW